MYNGNKKTKRDVNRMLVFLFLAFYAGIIVRGHFWDPGLSKPFNPPEVQAKVVEVEAVPTLVPTPTPTAIPTPTPKPLTTYEIVDAEIKRVFGEHYDKAMIVLQGDGSPGACAENRYLDPYAVNDNTSWGGIGRDRGVFQINDVMHPLTDAQAFDYEQNIWYAWRMYRNDSFTFTRWTCGDFYGI